MTLPLGGLLISFNMAFLETGPQEGLAPNRMVEAWVAEGFKNLAPKEIADFDLDEYWPFDTPNQAGQNISLQIVAELKLGGSFDFLSLWLLDAYGQNDGEIIITSDLETLSPALLADKDQTITLGKSQLSAQILDYPYTTTNAHCTILLNSRGLLIVENHLPRDNAVLVKVAPPNPLN